MTKLVRKLKQMAKKRAHRATVQKRKFERAERTFKENKQLKEEQLEHETDLEIARLEDQSGDTTRASTMQTRVVGGLVLEVPQRKGKKKMSRKQTRRRIKLQERGAAIADQIERKLDVKRRRVKLRAQIRNTNLHE